MTSLRRKCGGLRPAARFVGYSLLGVLGGYGADRQVDWSRVRRLVFVCSGNICRSPYAEALARMRGIDTVSFGIHANGIAPADPSASRIARLANVDLSGHVSTRAADYQPSSADLLLAMEPPQLAAVRALVVDGGVQASLLGLWCRRRRPYLPDPYGHIDDCFRFVFSFIDEALQAIEAQLPQPRQAGQSRLTSRT